MNKLTEIRRATYGHNSHAINKHSERWYRADNGMLYVLSRTLDGIPPFFEAYGPFRPDHTGLLPRLPLKGEEYWGDGWTWDQAEDALNAAIDFHPAHLATRLTDMQRAEPQQKGPSHEPTQPHKTQILMSKSIPARGQVLPCT